MAINLYSVAPPWGLFNLWGKLFKAEADINVSRGTTIPQDILNALSFLNTISPPIANLTSAFGGLPGATSSYQSSGSGTVSAIQAAAQALVIAMAANDQIQPDNQLSTALKYVITQMNNTAQSLNRSTTSVAVANGGGNIGNGVMVHSNKNGSGLLQESMIAETISGTFTGSGLTASISLKGQNAASSTLGQDWPMGSGGTYSLNSVDANSSSMLTNGGMESWNVEANVPDNWIPVVATPGTTILQTVLEVQQIVVAGTPTGGGYILGWTNAAGKTQYTALIAFNATASAVQSALRALTGLGSVNVVNTAGAPPNQTLKITFAGAGGSQNMLTAINSMTGGAPTITISRLTPGTPQVFAGSFSCQFLSNGAELTEIRQLIPAGSLAPLTAYGVNLWACLDNATGAGAYAIDLFDGSAVINDAQGNANSISFTAANLTVNFQSLQAIQANDCVFRTPAVLPPLVYLRIRVTAPVTNARSTFFDNVGMTRATEIYSGGPVLALFSGSTGWSQTDTITVTTTNNRAGVVREWCERNFGMAALGLKFPTSGAPTIPDNVVS